MTNPLHIVEIPKELKLYRACRFYHTCVLSDESRAMVRRAYMALRKIGIDPAVIK